MFKFICDIFPPRAGRRSPHYGEVAKVLGVTMGAVHNMRYRNKINPKHWPVLLKLAHERGVKLSFSDLMAAYNTTLPPYSPPRMENDA